MNFALAFALLGAPANATDAEVCRHLSQIVYIGVIDGAAVESLVDGIERTLRTNGATDADEGRILAASYLTGYASGLVHRDAATVATAFYTGCVAEDA